MRVAFFHDAPLTENQGMYYSQGFTATVWRRYLRVFDEVLVSTRVKTGPIDSLGVATTPGTDFRPIRSYTTPRSLTIRPRKVLQEVQLSLIDADCVIVRLPSVLGWIAYFAAKKLRLPILVELVGCPWDSFRLAGPIGRTLAPVAFGLTRYIVAQSEFVIYVTEKFLQSRYPTKGASVSISNVDLHPSPQALDARLARRRDRSDVPLIGSVGKVDLPYKGYPTVLTAMSSLADRGLKPIYEVVGDGDPTPLSRKATDLGLSDQMVLKGRKTREQLDVWLDSIDIYVQPSLTEGLPRAVIEAMARGLPIIASDIAGHRELLDSNSLFKAGKGDELALRLEHKLASDLREDAQRNFIRSLDYSHDRLQERRDSFLRRFAERTSSQGARQA